MGEEGQDEDDAGPSLDGSGELTGASRDGLDEREAAHALALVAGAPPSPTSSLSYISR